jgi:hypothetical protein
VAGDVPADESHPAPPPPQSDAPAADAAGPVSPERPAMDPNQP